MLLWCIGFGTFCVVSALAPARSMAAESIPTVRVLLNQRATQRFTFGVETPAVIRSLEDASVFLKLKKSSSIEAKVTSTGFVFDGKVITADTVEVVAENDVVLTPRTHFRGRLRFHRTSDNRLQVVNVVALDDYVASVVDGEMPIEFGTAARMAQAVTARTYVLYHMQHANPVAIFDVHATVQSQKYLGLRYHSGSRWLSGETKNARQVVESTAGLVLLRDGQLLCSYFSACCGGTTTDGAGYFTGCQISAVDCGHCEDCPLHRWERSKAFADTDTFKGRRLSELQALNAKPPGGYELRFQDEQPALTVSRMDLQRTLFRDWPSDRFELQLQGGKMHAQGRGHGHGVGLCQWGARGMSHAGRTCLEILRHYYPETSVVRLKYDD